MENTAELIKIVNSAIPLSECAVKRMHEEWRRERLLKDIQKLLEQWRSKAK